MNSISRDLLTLADALQEGAAYDMPAAVELLEDAARELDTSGLVTEAPVVFEPTATYIEVGHEDEMTVAVSLDRETPDFGHILKRKVVLIGISAVINEKVVSLDCTAMVKRVMCNKKEPPWYPGEQILLVIERPTKPGSERALDSPAAKKGESLH